MAVGGSSLLVVCTANYCRSPMAERLLAQALDLRGLSWRVSSAGTRGYDNSPMHPLAAQALAEYGCDSAGFRSRQVTTPILEEADLILTATREHRSAVVRMTPRVIRRTFTLLQFARLCSFVPNLDVAQGLASIDQLVLEAQMARSEAPGLTGDGDDLQDPMGQTFGAFRSGGSIIRAAVEDIVRPLPGWRGLGSGAQRDQ